MHTQEGESRGKKDIGGGEKGMVAKCSEKNKKEWILWDK